MMHNVTMAFDVSLQKEENIKSFFCSCSHELDVDLYWYLWFLVAHIVKKKKSLCTTNNPYVINDD